MSLLDDRLGGITEHEKEAIKSIMAELIGDVHTYKRHEMDDSGWKEYKRKQYSMKEMDEALHVQCRRLRQKVSEL